MWLLASRKTQPTRPSCRVPCSFRPRLEALEDRCLLNAGDLDPTFGNGGIVTTAVSSNDDLTNTVLLQPDGKIVVAGATSTPSGTKVMSLARYNVGVSGKADGSLDSTFGSGGIVVSGIDVVYGPGPHLNLPAAALYPPSGTANDGKIVVARGQIVARFNANGSLDTSFGKLGSVTPPGNSGRQTVVGRQGVVIQPDGKIVVAGWNGTATAFELSRFDASGTLDTSFGSRGTATLNVGPSTYGMALGRQANGKLVVAGVTGSPYVWELARFNAKEPRNNKLPDAIRSLGEFHSSTRRGTGFER